MGRATRRAAACAAVGLLAAGLQTVTAHAAAQNRIDLTVLLVDDGGPATAAIAAELTSEGTPYTTVKLSDPNRPTINAAFLSDTLNGAPRAKFEGVVLPNDNPFGTGSAEMTALATYEATFGIRQIDAYTYAQPSVGLNWAQNPGYIDTLDGTQGGVTAAGTAGPFGYLEGERPLRGQRPQRQRTYRHVATPLTTLPAGSTFTPLVDAPIPGTSSRGSPGGRVRPRQPQGTGRHLRLQPVPAAVPAAGARHGGLGHAGSSPRVRPELLRGPRRRPLPVGRSLEQHPQAHPGRRHLPAQHQPGPEPDPDHPLRRRHPGGVGEGQQLHRRLPVQRWRQCGLGVGEQHDDRPAADEVPGRPVVVPVHQPHVGPPVPRVPAGRHRRALEVPDRRQRQRRLGQRSDHPERDPAEHHLGPAAGPEDQPDRAADR